MTKSPEEEKLLRYYENNKNDLDGGFHNSMVAFAKDCFKEITLNDKAKVCDVHKYLMAVHDVTVQQMEESFKKHLEAIRKLDKAVC